MLWNQFSYPFQSLANPLLHIRLNSRMPVYHFSRFTIHLPFAFSFEGETLDLTIPYRNTRHRLPSGPWFSPHPCGCTGINIHEVMWLHNDRSSAQYCDVLRSTAQLRRRFCCSNRSRFDFCCSALRGTALLRVLCECCRWFARVRLQRLDAVQHSTAQYCDALRSTARSVNAP